MPTVTFFALPACERIGCSTGNRTNPAVSDTNEIRILIQTLILPPAGPLLLAAVGLLYSQLGRRRTTGTIVTVIGLASLWLLSTPAVSGQLMKWGRQYPVLDFNRPATAEAIVVLAGGTRRYAPEYNDDAPNEITLQRIAYGARVARETGLPLLVTGGRGEAPVMREFLVRDFGLTPKWVESAALNTRENAEYSAAIFERDGISSIILVTSSLHMPRAIREFRAQGLIVTPAPVSHYAPPDGLIAKWVPGIAGLRDSRNALYEMMATAVYALQGR